MSPDALLGAAVVVTLTLGGAIIHLVFRAGQLTSKLGEIQSKLMDVEKQFLGMHRRFTEQDSSLDATRDDLKAIRIELELNDYVRLRPKTQT